MAESINIPIQIVTKEALDQIKVFSKQSQKSFNELNKVTQKQNDILENVNANLNILTSTEKTLAIAAGGLGTVLAIQNRGVLKIVASTLGFNTALIDNSKLLKAFIEGGSKAAKTTGILAKTVILFDKGIFGLALNLSTASIALFGLGKATELFEGEMIQATGTVIKFSSVLTGVLAAGVVALIEGTARLSMSIGTSLVESTEEAVEAFIEFEQKTFVFTRTINGFNKAFGESIGTAESWTRTVNQLSSATGFTQKALRGAVTEIVATTSAMGFNEEQQKKLLEITTDYASFLGDNVVQTTIEFISALNGQAQSVQKYGVKLGQTYIQQQLLNKGVAKNLSQLTESEKIQLRFNTLLKQYEPIAGNAVSVTSTLAGQQKVLDNNLTNLSQAFGRGAAIIENNNLAAAGLNVIVGSVNETVVEATGFFTALGGRLLQIGGFVLKLTFNLLALYKILTLINFVLGTKLLLNITNFPFPIMNKSLADLVRNLGVTYFSFNSLGDIVKTVGSIFIEQAKVLISSFAGIERKALSVTNVIKQSFTNAIKGAIPLVKSLALATLGLGKSLLLVFANPIVLAIGAIAAALFGLFKAIEFIEEKTGFLRDIGAVLKEVFVATVTPIIKKIKSLITTVLDFLETIDLIGPLIKRLRISFNNFLKFLSGFANSFKDFIKKSVGLLIVGLTKILDLAAGLLAKNPFNIFSKDQIDRINSARDRVRKLGTDITNLSFDFTKLKDDTSRSIASVNKDIKKVDITPLVKLKEDLKDVGLTDIDKLKREREERLSIIQDALNSEGKSYKLAKELEDKINKDYSLRLSQIRKKETDELNSIREKEKNQRESEEKERLQFIENYKNNFVQLENEISGILATIGESASNALAFSFGGKKTEFEKRLDQSLEELEENFKAGRIGEVEFELEKKKLKKQRKELEKNTSLGISTGILNSIVRGSQGAKDLVRGFGALAADLFIPGLGQAIGPLLDVFSQGPEEVKKLVEEFANALPQLIENIILSIPAIIEALADNADKIIISLVERVDDIVIALVKAMPRVAAKLAAATAFEIPLALTKEWPNVALNLAKEMFLVVPGAIWEGIKKGLSSIGLLTTFRKFGELIYNGFWELLKGLGNFLFNVGKALYKGFWEPMQSVGEFFYDLGKSIARGFIDSVKSLVSEIPVIGGTGNVGSFLTDTVTGTIIGGGVGSVVGIVGGLLAKGGIVPTGYPNDTFPARLTSGELVIDRSTTQDLQEFLAMQNEGSINNDSTVGILAKILDTLQTDKTINTSVEFNGDTLADIILELNRNNARIA